MDLLLFVLFLVVTFGSGSSGALFPTGDWYRRLSKPVWVPPNWVFPIVWTSIYILIAFAAARVAGQPGSAYAMVFWAGQMTFATLWTPVFFGLRRLKGALPIMAALWIAVAGATFTHFQLDFWAGLAFVPYLIWVTVAGALNVEMVRLNPNVAPLEPAKL